MKRSVCRLLRALYGHQDSGTYWEEHRDTQVPKAGFESVLRDTWPACYYCKELQLLLVVYVDDFKLAGPSKCFDQGWSRLRKGLDLEPPTPTGLYLGCLHEKYHEGSSLSVVCYNMESFSRSVLSYTFS